MHALDLRPRSPSELVDAGFRLLRRHYGAFVTLSALAYIPSLLFQLLQLAFTRGTAIPATATIFAVVALMIPYYAFTEGSLTVLASEAYHTGTADVGAAVRRAVPRVIPAAIALLLTGVLVATGFVFLVVPGIYLAFRVYTTLATTVLDGVGPFAALSRTWSRTRGRVGHMGGTIALTFLLYFVCVIGATILAGVAVTLGSQLLGLALTAIVTVLVYPMMPIVSTLLYYDLRIRAEGYDLEVLSGQLDGAPLGAA